MSPSFPRPVDQMLFALPYGIIAALFTSSVWEFIPYAPTVVGVLTFTLTTLAVVKGHGNTMDLGEFDREPEWYEFVIRPWLFNRVPLYWYDFIGHCISGLTYTIPIGIATMNPILGLSGLAKGPAYAISKRGDAGTAGGELLTGAFLWGCLII